MSKVDRQPAVKRPAHPAADLPSRDSAVTPAPAATSSPRPTPPIPTSAAQPRDLPNVHHDEKFSTPVATRVRPTTEQRVNRSLDNLPRSWSKQAFFDAALNEFMDRHNLDPDGAQAQ